MRSALAAVYAFLGSSVLASQNSPDDIELRIPLTSTPLGVDELIFDSGVLATRLGIDDGDAARMARRSQLAFSRRMNSIPSATGVVFDTTFREERLDDVISDILARADIVGRPDDAGDILARMRAVKRAFKASRRLAVLDELESLPEYWPAGYVPPLADMVDDLAWIPVRLSSSEIGKLVDEADPELRDHFESMAGPGVDALDNGSVASIGLEYMVLKVTREWPVSEVINSEFWDLAGPRLASNPPEDSDRVPTYVVAALIARRLDVEFESLDSEPDAVPQLIDLGAFGPMLRGIVPAQDAVQPIGGLARLQEGGQAAGSFDSVRTSVSVQAAGEDLARRVEATSELLDSLEKQLGEIRQRREHLRESTDLAETEIADLNSGAARQQAAIMSASVNVKVATLRLFGGSSRRSKAKKAKRHLAELQAKQKASDRRLRELRAAIEKQQAEIEGLDRAERETSDQLVATESTLRTLKEISASVGDAEMYEVAYFCRRSDESPRPGEGSSRLGTFAGI